MKPVGHFYIEPGVMITPEVRTSAVVGVYYGHYRAEKIPRWFSTAFVGEGIELEWVRSVEGTPPPGLEMKLAPHTADKQLHINGVWTPVYLAMIHVGTPTVPGRYNFRYTFRATNAPSGVMNMISVYTPDFVVESAPVVPPPPDPPPEVEPEIPVEEERPVSPGEVAAALLVSLTWHQAVAEARGGSRIRFAAWRDRFWEFDGALWWQSRFNPLTGAIGPARVVWATDFGAEELVLAQWRLDEIPGQAAAAGTFYPQAPGRSW